MTNLCCEIDKNILNSKISKFPRSDEYKNNKRSYNGFAFRFGCFLV